ncbi:MAG: hypothetical protein ABSH06_22295 [Thermodesulfobacteriota bacterium]
MGTKRNRNRRKADRKATKESPLDGRALFRSLVKYLKRPVGLVIAAVSLAAAVIGIVSYHDYLKDKREHAQAGVLASPASAQVRYLSIGSTRFKIDSPDGVFLKDGNLPILTLSLKSGKLLVTTTIRDAKGQIVAELTNNEWQTNKNSIFDRNYTDNALEVRDRDGKIALQVVHFGDTIHLAGIFRCRSGWTNVFCPVPEGGAVIDMKPPGQEPQHSIDPIFEYPSELHFGSCPGLSSLEKIITHGPGNAYRLTGALDICKK